MTRDPAEGEEDVEVCPWLKEVISLILIIKDISPTVEDGEVDGEVGVVGEEEGEEVAEVEGEVY